MATPANNAVIAPLSALASLAGSATWPSTSTPAVLLPTSPTAPSAGCAFLTMLPLEIRIRIYELCVPQNYIFDCDRDPYLQHRPEIGVCRTCWIILVNRERYRECQDSHPHLNLLPKRRSALPSLLLLCRQINEEAESVLYGGNVFRFDGSPRAVRPYGICHKGGKMKRVLLYARMNPPAANEMPWSGPLRCEKYLGGVVKLGLIIVLPVRPAALEEEEPGKAPAWTGYLVDFLQYLDRVFAGREVLIAIHSTRSKEAVAEVVEAVMPGRCLFRKICMIDLAS
ncbi:hypothetical protein B0T24DRAFT_593847 [Lasiosphaeria ovina]|uniref:DUF7730 domain-containing protein n=1 Tax=Lasiosphaeria ovina TaxID=92902 RepID=A0AAE0KCK6_9PEZI|nr:hypothetical protein B0T24DRAFT_593847 [Lasiosphaeria ovina]